MSLSSSLSRCLVSSWGLRPKSTHIRSHAPTLITSTDTETEAHSGAALGGSLGLEAPLGWPWIAGEVPPENRERGVSN
jgi:hypothetical protein